MQTLLRVSIIVLMLSSLHVGMLAQTTSVPFSSPTANPLEARIGTMYQLGDDRLRLDIGTQLDLLKGQGAQEHTSWTVGVGFQTWTRLRSEANFKFPVETVDYWFGVHAMYGSAESWHLRLRVAHISSHLVDGLSDADGTLHPHPFVYSREFAELLGGYALGVLRPYAGATFMWSTKPNNPDPVIPQAGVDLRIPIHGSWWLTGGYDFKLIGINGVYGGTSAAQLGARLDAWGTTGLWFGIYGYGGRSMHGMFYTSYDSYLAVGFQVLW